MTSALPSNAQFVFFPAGRRSSLPSFRIAVPFKTDTRRPTVRLNTTCLAGSMPDRAASVTDWRKTRISPEKRGMDGETDCDRAFRTGSVEMVFRPTTRAAMHQQCEDNSAADRSEEHTSELQSR